MIFFEALSPFMTGMSISINTSFIDGIYRTFCTASYPLVASAQGISREFNMKLKIDLLKASSSTIKTNLLSFSNLNSGIW